MIFPFDVIQWLFNAGSSATSGIGNWLKGLGGSIASGFETGFVAILKDIWMVARPFLFILIGAIIVAVGTGWFFTGQIASPQMIAMALSAVK